MYKHIHLYIWYIRNYFGYIAFIFVQHFSMVETNFWTIYKIQPLKQNLFWLLQQLSLKKKVISFYFGHNVSIKTHFVKFCMLILGKYVTLGSLFISLCCLLVIVSYSSCKKSYCYWQEWTFLRLIWWTSRPSPPRWFHWQSTGKVWPTISGVRWSRWLLI